MRRKSEGRRREKEGEIRKDMRERRGGRESERDEERGGKTRRRLRWMCLSTSCLVP